MAINAQKWVTVSYVLLAAILFLVFNQALGLVWDMAEWPAYESWFVGPTKIAAAVLALIVFLVLRKKESANIFLKEVVIELSKVTWPERKETIQSAVVVVIMLALTSVVLFLIDSLWGTLTQKLLIN